jgi:DNA topoisomerase-1
MAKSLVIVESPAKAKTINKYLGNEYMVEASIGHIMDLPKNDIGVELARRTFKPTLIVSPGKEKVVDRLKKLAARADYVYLAPDPDREGEAIAAHLSMQLKPMMKDKSKLRRVTFNEITQKAVKAAFEHPREVDENLVDAQQTRRVLDRLVGYQVSPLLWDKVRRGLSAGRVQTVALRLIVEREQEINEFKPVEYWTIDAELDAGKGRQTFVAKLVGLSGEPLRVANGTDKEGKEVFIANALPDKQATDGVVAQLEKASWRVRSVEKKERRRNPSAPYTTSKLQQDASSRLGFNVRRTMGVAQRLYEGVEIGNEGTVGLITYMRTDSIRVAPEAIVEAREYIQKRLGARYLPASANEYKGKKDAQDAHEAIRPTNVEYTPESIRRYLSDEQFRLYRLIWQRFVSSQMTQAVFDQTTVDIEAKADRSYDFRVTGSVLKFDGFLKFEEEDKKAREAAKKEATQAEAAQAKKLAGEAVEGAATDDDDSERRLPELSDGEALRLEKLAHEQRFTQPPPRYNEASLVKVLEERGIGRPSTYASIINTIQDRDYVKKIQAKFVPTEIGTVVTKLLVKNFPYIFDTLYTAKLESELDAVEDGEERWTDLLNGFYDHFEEELAVAGEHMEDIKRMEQPTDEICDKCGSPLVLKWGKFGSFYSCSNFTRVKPVTVAMRPWKKDAKAVTKKIVKALHFPMIVRATVDDTSAYSKQVADVKEMAAAIAEAADEAAGKGRKVTVEQVSCDFTKENFAAKPDLSAPGADDVPEEEFCDNCGKVMVLKNGPWGPFMSCPDYSADPPCRTIRKLTQKVQQKPPVQLDEACPKCGKPLLQRDGQYGEFIACSGYPKCKYVKQELLEVPCPKCGGDIAVRKTKRGDVFYGCTNYPKCDFASNLKLVNEVCPKCDSAYLFEVVNDKGTYLVCPNNREALPKRRKRKGAEEEKPTTPECNYQKKVGPPKPVEVPVLTLPDPEKTRPVVQSVA